MYKQPSQKYKKKEERLQGQGCTKVLIGSIKEKEHVDPMVVEENREINLQNLQKKTGKKRMKEK